MSKFHFGTGRGKVPSATAKKIAKIAQRHGCDFYAVTMPEGPRYWFSGPNLGAPFDGATAKVVLEAVRTAGIKLP